MLTFDGWFLVALGLEINQLMPVPGEASLLVGPIVSFHDLLSTAEVAVNSHEVKLRRWTDVGLENLGHLVERVTGLLLAVRRDAIAGHVEGEVAHIRVVRGEKHTDIAGDGRQYDSLDTQLLKQNVERRREKARMFGLANEVIVLVGIESLHDRPAAHAVIETMLNLRPEVRLPAAEIVIDVDNGYSRKPGAALELDKLLRHRYRMAQKLVAVRKLQVIDDVDQ